MSINKNLKPIDAFIDSSDDSFSKHNGVSTLTLAFRIKERDDKQSYLELFELSSEMSINLAKDILRWLHIKELKL
jgi:hypothetical protein